MKKITLLLTMMLVPMMASAAVKVDSLYFDPDASNGVAEVAYHPFLKEGKTWNYQESYHNLWDDVQWTKKISYVINDTTEIDGKTYFKMYRTSEDSNIFYSALREENGKIWLYDSELGDHLLYDFTMSVGNSYCPSPEGYHYKLTSIEPMRFHDDQLLHVFYYDLLNHSRYFASAPIVEGVGCEEGWKIWELFAPVPSNGILHKENFLSCYEDGMCIFTADDFNDLKNPKSDVNIAYRPMVEDSKVWKVGQTGSNPVQMVEYYYFDGDTIIDGKTCKQMMSQRYVSPDHPDYDVISQYPLPNYVGAWYEEDKKVYAYDTISKQFTMMYDFSLEGNGTFQIDGLSYVVTIGPRQTGGIKGFKGVYRDIWLAYGESTYRCAPWMEGVGGIYGPPTLNIFNVELAEPTTFLMSCTVGDEVIYLNDEYEDGATPEAAGARNRFDFTHTIKTKPKAPRRSEDERSVYGEYDKLQLGINLNLLADDYVVRITDDSGNVIYEKAVNASTIVGLNIDISGYAKGHYTVTVENSQESFTGEFNTLPTGIEETTEINEVTSPHIYNLQGQRISTLQKGLNIVNGRKVVIK